jgi:hypothetical protein
MRTITWILKFYPHRWRERYQEEMLAVLEQHTLSLTTLFDLLLGALDARLDPAYHTKEGFMFHKLRDTRTLSTVYLFMLAISFFSANFWGILHHSLAFVDNPIGVLTDSLVVLCELVIHGLCLIALFITASSIFINAVKNRQSGTLTFALVCSGLGIVGASQIVWFFYAQQNPTADRVFVWLLIGGIAFWIGAGLFVAGVKGLKLFQTRQWSPMFFALVILLLLPTANLLYQFWGVDYKPTVAPGDIGFFLMTFAIYLPMGALLLALANDEPGVRSWQVTRGFGVVLALALILNLAAVEIWNINRWIGGDVWIFDPTRGVWPFFGGQWIGPLITNMLVLAVALGFALLTLIQSFQIQRENKQMLSPQAM